MSTLQRRTSQTFQRLRKLSGTIRNAVVPKSDKVEPRRRPSYGSGERIVKEDIWVVGPSSQLDNWEQMVEESMACSTRQSPPRPGSDRRAVLRKMKPKQSRGEAERLGDDHKTSLKPPHEAVKSKPWIGRGDIPFPHSFRQTSLTRTRNCEEPIPVPRPDLKETMFTPFAVAERSRPLPQTPEQRGSRSSSTPPGPSTNPYAYRALPDPPLTSSLAKARESVYFSTGLPTVRRQGAIRRTSSTRDANFVPQHLRTNIARGDERAVHRTHISISDRHQARPLPPRPLPSKPQACTPIRPPLQIRPQPRDVPRDIPSELDSEFDSAVTPHSASTFIPPALVATSPVAVKVQASMRVQETVAPRAVVMSGPRMHRAVSHKALVVQSPADTLERKDKRSAGQTQTVEVFGIEIYKMDRAQALHDEVIARRRSLRMRGRDV